MAVEHRVVQNRYTGSPLIDLRPVPGIHCNSSIVRTWIQMVVLYHRRMYRSSHRLSDSRIPDCCIQQCSLDYRLYNLLLLCNKTSHPVLIHDSRANHSSSYHCRGPIDEHHWQH